MEVHVWMALQPAVILRLVRVEIVEDDMDLASSVLSDNPVHEVEKFKPSPPLVLTPRHLARRNVESGEERRRAMPGVVVQSAPGRSASSDSPASAPALGSTASRRRPEPEHF